MSFAKDSIRTFIVRFILIFINILGGIILARWLGPEGVGVMALSALMQNFALRFGNLGFGSGFSFFIAQGKTSGKKVLGLAFGLCVFVGVVSIVILMLIWKQDFSPWQKMPAAIFFVSLVSIFPFFMNYLLSMILSGHLDIRATNVSEVIRIFCFLSLLFVFVIVLNWGVLGAVCADLIAQLADFFYLLAQVRRKQDTPVTEGAGSSKLKLLAEIWKYGRWNYSIMFFNFYIGELPIMFLSYFYPYNIVGFFSMGRGLMEKTRILPNAFSQALFPYTAASEEKIAVNRTNILCRNFLVITGCIVIALVVFIRPLIILLYGKSFLPVIPVFYALIPAILLWPFSQFLAVHMAGFGNPKRVFLRSLCALPGCILACFIFIPRFGAVGAAFSVSIVYVILAAVSVYIYIKSTDAKLLDIILLRNEDWNDYRGIYHKIRIKYFTHQGI
jgi:O-antigen/teichoic acid export membrane protein